jgi:opacity protein-like surface antigen
VSKRKIAFLLFLGCFLVIAVPARLMSAAVDELFSLKLFGGGSYHLLDDIKKSIDGSNDLWYTKWRVINEGGFRPFHWGFQFGGEFEARISPHFSVGLEIGYLRAGGDSSRKVSYEDGYVDVHFDQTLNAAVKAVPMIITGAFHCRPGKRFSYFGGIGLGLCLGMMEWRYESTSEESQTHDKQEWNGHSLAPVLQARAGIEMELWKGISFVVEAEGLLAQLRSLKGRLTENGVVTEDTVFWFMDSGYYRAFFLPQGQVPDTENTRKGIADLSGFSLRGGIVFRL